MKKQSYLKICILAALIAAIVWALTSETTLMLRSIDDLRAFVGSFGALAPVLYILLYILATVLFLPGAPFTIAGGVLFGPALGTIYVLVGASIGATLAFLFSRFVGKEWVDSLLRSQLRTLWKYDKALEEYGFLVTLWLRLVPLFPFNGLNFALGLTRVPVRDYILGTMIGIIPGVFIYAYLGGSLATLNIWQIISAVILLLLLSAGGVVMKRATRHLSKNEFDVIVIGAGAAGLNIAGFMNRAGFKVLLIDKTDKNIGGDCLNFGCVPSKALIHVARMVHAGQQAKRFGLTSGGAVDMKAVREYIDSKREHIRTREHAGYFREKGMTVVLGTARFASHDTVEVGGAVYRGRKILIATGSRPRKLRTKGIEQVQTYDNETIFDIETLPQKLLVIGGGPIGLELGQAFSYLGSEVTVVHRGKRLLEKEDPEIAEVVRQRLAKSGITFHLNSELQEFPSGHEALVRDMDGNQATVSFDAVLVSAGRELVTGALDLQKAGIEASKTGMIRIDSYLRTTNKNVFVSGDAAGQHQFTHAGELHAALIIRNWFSPFRKKLSTDQMAWVTFTDPEVATFGLNEPQLKKRGIAYRTVAVDFEEDDRAIIDEYTYGKLKLFVAGDKVVGGTMAAPNAGDMAQELILASSSGISLNSLFTKVYPYPVGARVIKQAIGGMMAEKLTGRTKWLLKLLYH